MWVTAWLVTGSDVKCGGNMCLFSSLFLSKESPSVSRPRFEPGTCSTLVAQEFYIFFVVNQHPALVCHHILHTLCVQKWAAILLNFIKMLSLFMIFMICSYCFPVCCGCGSIYFGSESWSYLPGPCGSRSGSFHPCSFGSGSYSYLVIDSFFVSSNIFRNGSYLPGDYVSRSGSLFSGSFGSGFGSYLYLVTDSFRVGQYFFLLFVYICIIFSFLKVVTNEMNEGLRVCLKGQ